MKKRALPPFWSGVVSFLIFIAEGGLCAILCRDYLLAAGPGPGPKLLAVVLVIGVVYLLMLLDSVLHELGHLLCGLLSGYGFLSFRIGSLMLQRTREGLRFCRMSLAGTAGQCLMSPPELKNGRIPCLLYNMGGVLMGLCTALCFFLLSLLGPGTPAATLLRM